MLIECTTTRSISAPAGRAEQLGEASRRAKPYQPPCHSIEAGGAGSRARVFAIVGAVVAARRGDRQPRDAVADLAQAQAEALGRRGAVEAGFAQRLDQDLALLLV